VVSALTLPVLLGNLAFLQTIAVAPFGSNGPLWSLAFEFWYYIWFPALVVLVRQRRLSPALLALLIGVANPELYWGFISWLVGWALLLGTQSAPAKPVARYWTRFAAGVFAAMLLTTGMVRHTWLDGWSDVPLAISFGLLLQALVCTALPFPQALAPIAHYGRKASFSLYAIHFPLVALAGGWMIGRARLVPSERALLLVVALTAFCMLAGWLFASGSEAFTPHLRDWLRRRLLPPPQPSGVA
jgi:peptidoglycan/LPS O-acetylase OafA/YrhL